MSEQLEITNIRLDGGTQPRAELDQFTIDEYADNMAQGDTFPPVTVFYDGDGYWLADGYHRLEAHKSLGLVHVNTDVRQGTLRDAVLFSVSANYQHGKRRSNADKRRAVLVLLGDEKWVEWSDREIARQCKVHHQMVGNLRSSLDDSSSERVYTTKYGTTTTMNTGKIGKSKRSASQKIAPDVRRQIQDTSLIEDKKSLRRLANMPVEKQRDVIGRVTRGEAKTIIKATQQITHEKLTPPTPLEDFEGPYQVIYCDPPWKYEHQITPNRDIENHYPPMLLEDICALDIPAADDAMLFMWATNPKLCEAMQVIEAWEFIYRTNMVWIKNVWGQGHYVRGQHEMLLIAKRGDFPKPLAGDEISSIIDAARGEHSAKPHEVYTIIERMYPHASKIELFARNTRDGWQGWGNEAD